MDHGAREVQARTQELSLLLAFQALVYNQRSRKEEYWIGTNNNTRTKPENCFN
jgi:hypothetical protein